MFSNYRPNKVWTQTWYNFLGTCPEDNCTENYIGESGRGISERIIDHDSRDRKSLICKHSSEKCHQHFHTNSFKIIGNDLRTKLSNAKSQKHY